MYVVLDVFIIFILHFLIVYSLPELPQIFEEQNQSNRISHAEVIVRPQ